jgi:hypothetical protein
MKQIAVLTWALAACAVHAQPSLGSGNGAPALYVVKDSLVPATVTIHPRKGKVGRKEAVPDGLPTRLQFASGAKPVECLLRTPEPRGKILPGKAAEAVVMCSADVEAPMRDLSFKIHEGSRLIGQGVLKP